MNNYYMTARKRLCCLIVVLVFGIITILEPVTAVAAENEPQQNQAATEQAEVAMQNNDEETENLPVKEQAAEAPAEGNEQELDYEESASSWRFDNGQLIEEADQSAAQNNMRKSRAAFIPWSKNSNGRFVNASGVEIKDVSGKYAVKKGIDVSKHQGKIDWAKVKASGIDFAIIRCGYGSDLSNQDDSYWEYNVSECERLGIPYGVYIYSYANTKEKAKSEAQHTLRLLKGHTPSYPVYYDLEDATVSAAGNAAIVEMADIYCSAIENAGYKAGIYASLSWWTGKLNNSRLDKYEKWVAQWSSSCTYKGSYRLWQATSDGTVPGISGRVDLNFEFQRDDTDSFMGGWKVEDGKYYFYNAGELVKSQWITYHNKKYYLDENGARVTGVYTIDGITYYFGSDGLLQANKWITLDGKKYYVDSSSKIVKSTWMTLSGNRYYFDAEGACVTGVYDIDGDRYFFNKDGILQTDKWVNIDGEKYYVDLQGKVQKELSDADTHIVSPIINKWTRISPTSMKVTWDKKEDAADGYQIQYSRDKSFAEGSDIGVLSIKNPETLSAQINNLDKNAKYYVRMRTYIKSADKVYFSQWANYANVKADKTSSASILKKSGRTFELNSSAGQAVGQYDVLQGSCTDGTYVYYVLYNKSNDKCRILKSRISDNATIKVSGVLNINHGNDITYNADTKKLVTVHYSQYPYRLSEIDPGTLTVTGYKDIVVPESLEGADKSTLAGIQGFSAIAYSSERNQYVLRLIKSHNYLLLDENMTPVKYVKVSKYNSDLNQGIDASNDYIYDVQSKAGSYNTITAYDWDGEYQYKTKVPVSYEMESLYHSGDKFYAGVYSSYYQTYYTTHYKTKKVKWKRVKVKTKKVRGKWQYKRVWKYKTQYVYKTVKYKTKYKVKYRYKKVHGKWQYKYKYKYKTKKKKVRVTYRVPHRRLIRANYVYDIGNI